ncbi:MAG: SAM-dependent methyltransferase [Ruminococcaceae bacterium]|nr:SAM-dependent methyltransferase [Oscillospiraceae bacterium]
MYYNRLSAIKSLVPKGTRLLDIGCDHALLPIELVKEGIIKEAIASDVNPMPLKRAENDIKEHNLSDKIKTVLSNGFENVSENDYDCAAICGMGGHLIAEIIQSGENKSKSCKLILQPMSYPEVLRKYLYDNGFEIENEVFAIDNKKPYVIILASFIGKKIQYEYEDLIFGKFRPENECFKAYEDKICRRLKKRLLGLLKHALEFS